MLILSLALFAAVLAVAGALFADGMRSGDRVGETQISHVELDPSEHAIRFKLENPGDQGVLVGASVRSRSLRLRLESGAYVSVPRITSTSWPAARHAVIVALAAGESATVLVTVPAGISRRGELIVAIGEQRRLKVLHRALELDDRPATESYGRHSLGWRPKRPTSRPARSGPRPDLGHAPCELRDAYRGTHRLLADVDLGHAASVATSPAAALVEEVIGHGSSSSRPFPPRQLRPRDLPADGPPDLTRGRAPGRTLPASWRRM